MIGFVTLAKPELPYTIAEPIDFELVIRKSRFLTRLEKVTSIAEADAAIARVRKLHYDARHHCTALIIGPNADQQRSSDDGEPSGTAGAPMLQVLRRAELTDVVAIVTRYFGGVLLGAGGLVRAYSASVAKALELATLMRRVELTQAQITVPLADAGWLEHALRSWANAHEAVFDPMVYDTQAEASLWIRTDTLRELETTLATLGAPAPTIGGARLVEVKAI